MTLLRRRSGRLLALLACLMLVAYAIMGGGLPSVAGRPVSIRIATTAETRLGAAVRPLTRAHAGSSGVVPLADGRDAFAARALLADAADSTLDVQYYIWHADMSGTLMFDALSRAADRGVRVRLLLDDHNTNGLDDILAALDAHRNIEVRLFNPVRQRRWRVVGYLTDFARLNRRMHNKSFTADNQVTIIGGRNVGDEYFGTGDNPLFIDLDVMAIGPVVDDVSRDFDRYWVNDAAYAADRLVPAATPASMSEVHAAAARTRSAPAAQAYLQALDTLPFVRQLLHRELECEWAQTTLVSDDPGKVLGLVPADSLLWTRLKEVVGAPARELQLISPYFVPGAAGVEYLAEAAARGVRIRILTNSLEATDVAAVHAGYAKRRRPLLQAGIELFEMKRSTSAAAAMRVGGSSGSGASSLHAKTFAVDGSKVFVGSFNFDPRSARLNTELGFVIESPTLARVIAEAFERGIPSRSYKVGMTDAGTTFWTEQRDGRTVTHEKEPGTGFWLRLGVRILSWLPIEWLL